MKTDGYSDTPSGMLPGMFRGFGCYHLTFQDTTNHKPSSEPKSPTSPAEPHKYQELNEVAQKALTHNWVTEINVKRKLRGYDLLSVNNHLSAHPLPNKADKQARQCLTEREIETQVGRGQMTVS